MKKNIRLMTVLAGALCALAGGVHAQTTGPAGGSDPVNNYQPSVAMTQFVTDQGIFPCTDCGGPAAHTIGALRTLAGGFAPGGYLTANGQLQSIAQNTSLFSIAGTTFGGDGQTTFALPDLGGRAIVGAGQGPGLSSWVAGQQDGQAQTVLSAAELASHTHGLPGGDVTGATGGTGAFSNFQPSLGMTYMIAAEGPFPSPSTASGVPFLGQISPYLGNFTPGGWLEANGQELLISEYDALFSLIGTTYGGDGQDTFALPDLSGRVAVGTGNGFDVGESGGQEEVLLSLSQLPNHAHELPGGGFTDPTGGGQPFDNMQPYLALNYLIALQGVFPCQTASPTCSAFDEEPILGEVVLYAGPSNFIPRGWALAQGQLLSIAQNQALFALLGTQYGGNGQTTFALPDLRGRTVIGTNGEFPFGSVVGEQFTTLALNQMPEHVHSLPDALIPEPGTWTLMIAGFGLTGAALRRRRTLAV